jgi:phospholipase/carboxylesterase
LSLNAIAIPPANGQPPEYLLILLHGWGADASDLAPLATVFNFPDVQYLFPNAPFPHPQVPNGRAWYALETPEYTGLEASRQMLRDWLLTLPENTGVPLERVFLGGFSQGGAMTMDVGLSLPFKGLICLSGYLHGTPEVKAESLAPVFIAHGTEDTVVPVQAAQRLRELLLSLGTTVDYHELEMGHEIPMPVLSALNQFLLSSRLAENAEK